jgi:hypothetical protein
MRRMHRLHRWHQLHLLHGGLRWLCGWNREAPLMTVRWQGVRVRCRALDDGYGNGRKNGGWQGGHHGN